MGVKAGGCVAITGVSSFLGFHLARGFAEAGWRVEGLTRQGRGGGGELRERRLAALPAAVRLSTLDLRDRAATEAWLRREKPELWIHHAGFAEAYASLNYDLRQGWETNVEPLYWLYPALRAEGVAGVIVTGSSMEYGDSGRASEENEACRPSTPYGLTKLAESLAACQLSGQHGVPTRVARVFIPFGWGDAPGKVLPATLRALRAGTPIELSPCTQERDFLAVEDLVRAYQVLAGDLQREGGAAIFNVARGEPHSLRAVLEDLARAVGASPELLRFGARPLRAGEPAVSYGDSRALRQRGWEATPLRESLRQWVTIEV